MEINANGQRFVTTPVESIGNCAVILKESTVRSAALGPIKQPSASPSSEP
jgi:hypothetical protein